MRRFFTNLLAVACCVLIALPCRGEGDNPPDFPPGVRPGAPPGFDGPAEKEKEENAFQLGQVLANVGYGLAGILTYFSLKNMPSAALQAWHAGRDATRAAELRREAERLKQWGEALEKKFPEAMSRLENAARAYQKSAQGLTGQLAQLATEGTWEAKTKDLDRHLDSLLTLPLMARRDRLKGELTILIDAWKRNRDPKPLEDWLAAHRDYDLIRTANGASWLTGYRRLQRELGGLAWKERGTTAELDRWIASPVSEKAVENADWASWAERYRLRSAEERKAAVQFARDANAEVRSIFGDALRPTVSLAAEGIREPGQFLFHHGADSGELDSSGVLNRLTGSCRRELASLGAKAASAARLASPVRQLGRFVWPLAPLTAGTAVGGYYSAEGIRYWLGATSSPSSERK